MEQPKEYYAFISYKREDKKEAKRLQHALEFYHLPNHLRQENPELPEYVRPVFRDMTDLEVGKLSAQIHSALEQSLFLIVVCSPRAAASKWVNDEVAYFISLGKQDKIIPYIIEGVPHACNPSEECYPPALLRLSKEKELLGANINEVGKDSATIRVVSRMFNIRFDTLYQRYQREQKKRRRQVIAACVLAFFFLSGIAGWIMHQNILLKEREWKMLENQAKAVSEKALTNFDDGYLAALLALEVLPKDLSHPNRPYVPEAEFALRRSLQLNSMVLKGHSSYVYCVAYSPDGKLIASASADQTVRVWSTYSGECLRVLEGHEDLVYRVNFSPDGRFLVSASRDSTLRIWDISRGACIQVLSNHSDYINDASFSSDGHKMASCSRDGSIIVWDTSTLFEKDMRKCKPLMRMLHSQSVNTIQFSPNGHHLLSASNDSTIRIWNVLSGECETIIRDEKPVICAYYDSRGSKIVSGARGGWNDKNCWVKIWDAKNSVNSMTFFLVKSELKDLRTVLWGCNDESVAILTDSSLLIWDCSDNSRYSSVSRENAGQLSLAISPDGYDYAIGSEDNKIHINPIYSTIRPIYRLQIKGGRDARFIANDKEIISMSRMGCRYWDARTGQLLKKHEESSSVKYILSSPTGRLLCGFEDEKVCVMDVESGKKTYLEDINGNETFLEFSHNDKYLLIAYDYALEVWDVEREIVAQRWKDLGDLPLATFTPDEKCIVSTSDTMGVYDVLDIATGHKRKSIDNNQNLDGVHWTPTSLAVSPNANYLAVAHGKESIEVLNMKSGASYLSFNDRKKEINSISFSPDSKYLLTAGGWNFCIWDIESQQCIFSCDDDAISAYFSSDGKRIVTTSHDNIIHVYDFPPLQDLIDQTRERFKNRPLTPEERRKYYLE